MEKYLQQVTKQHLENIKHVKKLEQAKNEYKDTIPKLQYFRDRLYIDIMIPIPSNNSPLAFMEGTSIHTNELLVTLGDKYFAKMTTQDAIEYCNRKSMDIHHKQEDLLKEQKLLFERISFMNSQTFDETEIVEHYNEQEEKLWREQHAKSIKKMKAQEFIQRQKIDEQSADYYFSRLKELEAEELEANEL